MLIGVKKKQFIIEYTYLLLLYLLALPQIAIELNNKIMISDEIFLPQHGQFVASCVYPTFLVL